MKTHLRVLAIVVFILAIGSGTASAYNKANMNAVVISLDGVPRMVSTEAETVSDLLAELSGTIDADYILDGASESDTITENMAISLTTVTEKIVATTESIPYETVERASDKIQFGSTKVAQKGVAGQRATVKKEIYHGDKLISTEFVEEKVLTPAQDEIIEIGATGMIDGMVFSSAISAKVTAYTPFDAGCTGITATGTKAGVGTVAVDPKVIPLGSKVYVPGYGVAVAADTGGAIKGNRVDVCYTTKNEAFSWGVKNVTVYVLQ